MTVALDTLEAACTSILGHAEDALDQEGANGAPERSYVGHGRQIADCELLTVFLERLAPRSVPAGGQRTCSVLPRVTICVQVVRCRPSGLHPDAPVLDTASRKRLGDGWALWTWLTARWTDGTLIPGTPCRDIAFRELVPDPTAGMDVWLLRLDADLTPRPTPGEP